MKHLKLRCWHKATNRMLTINRMSFTPTKDGRGAEPVSVVVTLPEGGTKEYPIESVELLLGIDLPDMNGTDVYHGDLLKEYGGKGYTISKVVYGAEDDAWGWEADYVQSYDGDTPVDGRFSRFLPVHWILEASEVIGTVHENPDLAQQKRKPDWQR